MTLNQLEPPGAARGGSPVGKGTHDVYFPSSRRSRRGWFGGGGRLYLIVGSGTEVIFIFIRSTSDSKGAGLVPAIPVVSESKIDTDLVGFCTILGAYLDVFPAEFCLPVSRRRSGRARAHVRAPSRVNLGEDF